MDSGEGAIRVLHVDDQPEIPQLTEAFLQQQDTEFDCERAASADEGLGKLQASTYDCVVSDYDMPEQNGMEFLEAVRESYPELPFILFTGKGSEEVASDAISLGVTDYLQKSTDSSQYDVLANRIENAVEQRRSRAAAAETERRLRTIAEHTNDVLWTFTADWEELLFVNSVYEEIWGRSTAELASNPRSFLDGVHPEDRPLVEDVMARVSNGEPVDIEFRVNESEAYGRWVWVQGEPIVDDDGTVSRVAGFARDVTDRKSRELDREAMIEFLQRLYEIATDPEVGYEAKIDRLLDVGPELLGLPYGHLTRIEVNASDPGGGTQTIVEATGDHELLQPGEFGPLQQSYCQRTIRSAEVLTIENALEGDLVAEEAYNTFHLGCYIGHAVTVDDELYGTVFFAGPEPREEPFTDAERTFVRFMSKWIGFELERKRSRETLESQKRRFEEFAKVVSHDLRNPLNVATQHLELAAAECESEHVAGARGAIERSATLVDDLLGLAKAGGDLGTVEHVELPALVRRAWEHVDSAAGELAIETDATVSADPGQFQQAMENLLGNAVEHGGEDVSVTVGPVEDGFYVADDGPGIPEADREVVFEPGYTTTANGMGFGLHIVDEIVDAHGWEIDVTSSDTGGARFEITGVPRPPGE